MFNQNSFSIDSGNNPNNSFNFNSPPKRVSNQSNSFGNDQNDYDFGANLANYNFRDVNPGGTVNPVKPVTNPKNELEPVPRISMQNPIKKPQRISNNTGLDRITQKLSQNSLKSEDQRPRGLLKQKIKVDYAFDHKKPAQSEIVMPTKPMQKFPTYSEVNRSQISANLFSCMDAPQYERDFEVSPKVIARKYF